MRANATYNAEFCRRTRRLRERLVEAERDIALLETALAAERAAIRAEREALIEALESPEAQLAILQLAQDEVQGALMAAVQGHAECKTCGGLGRGMSRALLARKIESLCESHGLEAGETELPDALWPSVPLGRVRSAEWLRNPSPQDLAYRRYGTDTSLSGPGLVTTGLTRWE